MRQRDGEPTVVLRYPMNAADDAVATLRDLEEPLWRDETRYDPAHMWAVPAPGFWSSECRDGAICQILVGLPNMTVLGVEDVPGAALVVHFESRDPARDCPGCGQPGWVKDRPVVLLAHLPAFGRPVRLAWHKTGFQCPDPGCPQASWTSRDDRIAAPRLGMTHRAGRWIVEQVRRFRRAVAAVARQLGCDWHTVLASP